MDLGRSRYIQVDLESKSNHSFTELPQKEEVGAGAITGWRVSVQKWTITDKNSQHQKH